MLARRVARGQDAARLQEPSQLGQRPEWQVRRRQMPEELRAVGDVERIVGIGEPLQDVALLEDDGAWPLGRDVGLSCQCLRLLQDVYRDIDADRRAFASVLGQACGDGARPAADIENVVYLLDVRQEEGGIRLGRARLVGCDGVVGVALCVIARLTVLRYICHRLCGEANVLRSAIYRIMLRDVVSRTTRVRLWFAKRSKY